MEELLKTVCPDCGAPTVSEKQHGGIYDGADLHAYVPSGDLAKAEAVNTEFLFRAADALGEYMETHQQAVEDLDGWRNLLTQWSVAVGTWRGRRRILAKKRATS
ncbi:MAG: hypothetical protein JWQ89_4575 [Devosia sp.]|uniref:hypothetical protein n=1 Tax=Devosia sp. TaxID=1871048 RepID=UPI0026075C7C|nr:hypothetical protein [Devosia sp.]MDB5542848.1 hypothetical protein [Devosia sp.]